MVGHVMLLLTEFPHFNIGGERWQLHGQRHACYLSMTNPWSAGFSNNILTSYRDMELVGEAANG